MLKYGFLAAGLATLVASSAFAAPAETQGERCVRFMHEFGCPLSFADEQHILDGVQECKQYQSKGNTSIVILFNENWLKQYYTGQSAEKVMVVEAKGPRRDKWSQAFGDSCPMTKYNLGNEGIKDIIVASLDNGQIKRNGDERQEHRVFMLSNSGAVYWLRSSSEREINTSRELGYAETGQQVFELLTHGHSYSSVVRLKNIDGQIDLYNSTARTARPFNSLDLVDLDSRLARDFDRMLRGERAEYARQLQFWVIPASQRSLFRDN